MEERDRKEVEHITVCICTYKRPGMLQTLLRGMDNDFEESARSTVCEFAKNATVKTVYHVEPVQNIALARNKAMEHAEGTYVAFIDDDEYPERNWLAHLLSICRSRGADGVLGPVLPHFTTPPPKWVIRGKVFDRPSHATGALLGWRSTRTGNALMRRATFDGPENRFNPRFGSGGEDRDLFRRLIEKGYAFTWCQEAPVYETIPSNRWSIWFMLRRALLRGQVSFANPANRAFGIAQSAVAVVFYSAILPFLALVAYHLFVKYLVKLGDHVGRLLAAVGVKAVKENYLM
jgi:succinoglycan biosynthesis protein ExoM